MQTTYAFRNLAVSSLLNFQEKEFVNDFFNYFQCNSPLRSSIFLGEEHYKEMLDHNLNWFIKNLESFENEINQVIHTTHQTPINQYFEELKGYREWVCNVDENKLLYTLNKWNDEVYDEFKKKVDEETDKYFQSDNRKMAHLQEYEVPDYSFMSLLGGRNYLNPNKRKEINYNYFVIEKIPELLDLKFFPEYIHLLKNASGKFATIADKYILQYDNGKIVSSSTVIVNHLEVLQAANAITTGTNMKELPSLKKQKIKWKGTPQEFVELFAPMINDRRIYLNKESEGDTEPIVKILSETFEIKKIKGKGELMDGSLSTYFKEYNSNTIKS